MGINVQVLKAHKAHKRYISIAHRFLGQRKRIVLCLASVSFPFNHLLAHDWSHMHANKLWHASIVYIDLFVRTFLPLVISSNQKRHWSIQIQAFNQQRDVLKVFIWFVFCCVFIHRNYRTNLIAMCVLHILVRFHSKIFAFLRGKTSFYLQVNPQVQK